MEGQLKEIKDIFPDFQTEEALLQSKIKNVNLYKRENKIVLELLSERKINLKHIYLLENYLKKRFNVQIVEVKIESNIQHSMQEIWGSVIEYLSLKYPLTKAILLHSNLREDKNRMFVNLAVKGKDFLSSSGFEKIIETILFDFYGLQYKIDFSEKLDQELVQKQEENTRRIERMAIELAEQEIIVDYEKNDKKIEKSKKEETESKNTSQSSSNNVKVNETEIKEEKTPLILGRSLAIKENVVKVEDLGIDSGKIALEGEIIHIDSRELKSGKFLVMFDLYDGSSTITCKSFVVPEKIKEVLSRLKEAKGVKISGTAQFDPFAKELGIIANVIIETPGKKKEKRMDTAEEKRVELHMHTQMSQMDGITSVKDLIKRAMSWGMKSIAITDHGVVQAFPDAHKLLGRDNKDIKVIYGVEAYLVPDKTPSVTNPEGQSIDTTYCVLDLETTGLSFRTEKITEIGIMKIKNGEVIDSFETFVNPEKPIPYKVVEVTKITDEMVQDAPSLLKIAY